MAFNEAKTPKGLEGDAIPVLGADLTLWAVTSAKLRRVWKGRMFLMVVPASSGRFNEAKPRRVWKGGRPRRWWEIPWAVPMKPNPEGFLVARQAKKGANRGTSCFTEAKPRGVLEG